MKKISVNKSASKGIAFGKAYIAKKSDLAPSLHKISEDSVDAEISKLENALEKTIYEITLLSEKSEIFKAHLDVAQDPTLVESVKIKVSTELKNAELSLKEATDEICQMFEALDDEYLKERAIDIKDVSNRIMSKLKNVKLNMFDDINEEVIVFAQDLTPSDTADMNFKFIKGFVTSLGGITSHVAIIARQLEVPAMVGVGEIEIADGDEIILDAMNDFIIVNPNSQVVDEYKEKVANYLKMKEEFAKSNNLPTVTKDGRHVKLYANVGGVSDIMTAVKNSSEGIGLFRTEFLYMENSHFPTEEEQFEVYKKSIQENKAPMIVRTLDIGGDKSLPYYKFETEENPFLGWRAIRICLELRDIFKTQLRALLRASAYGDIRIMYPMIISVNEFRDANSVLEECKNELRNENISFNDNIETGVMIETPSAVFVADDLAKEADFFSIGTNDLTQYLLAVDRGNQKISHLYNTFNPAVLRAIKMVIDAGHKYGKEVGVCGEFASDEKALPILLGMGLDEFSVASSTISEIRYKIRNMDFQKSKELSLKVLEMSTTEDVLKLLD